MRMLISGSSGLIGTALVERLAGGGHDVVCLVRPGSAAQPAVRYDPTAGTIDHAALEQLGPIDAVIHLAGHNIIAGRWTAKMKQRIRSSRIDSTALLARTFVNMSTPPKVWLCASAIGYYGDGGDEELTEDSDAGDGFLSDTCRAWEAATAPALDAGVRIVHMRLGMVLAAHGGALAKMLTPFRLGLGGRIGHGRQWVSWIALDDLLGAIDHVLNAQTLVGPVNFVAPHPVTNAQFTKALGRTLRRPTLMRMPAFAARLAFGEMADAALLASARVVPARLSASAYTFKLPTIDTALDALLIRREGEAPAEPS